MHKHGRGVLCLIWVLLFCGNVYSEENKCLACHSRLTASAKSVHEALSHDCAVCHRAVEGTKHPEQKGGFRLIANIPALCFGCHDEAKFKGKFVHAPLSSGSCTVCHDPHRSDYPALLSRQINDLCVTCHPKLAKGTHLLTGLTGAHPTWKKPDPSRPGREMSCTSCHDPHSSDQSLLLLQPRLCSRCHKY